MTDIKYITLDNLKEYDKRIKQVIAENSNGEDCKIIDLDAAEAPINALTLEPGVYKLKSSTDAKNIKSLYFPLISGATLPSSPNVRHGYYLCAVENKIHQLVDGSDDLRIVVDIGYWDEDWNEIDDPEKASWRDSVITLSGGSFSIATTVKANAPVLKEYKNIDSAIYSNYDNTDTDDYYTITEQIVPTRQDMEDMLSEFEVITYVDTQSVPTNTFTGEVNITTVDMTWNPLSIDGDSNSNELIIPANTILLGDAKNATYKHPMLAYFPDGRIYEVWCNAANLGRVTTLHNPSTGGGSAEVAISASEPTGGEVIWIDPEKDCLIKEDAPQYIAGAGISIVDGVISCTFANGDEVSY